jgi:hypothetical protein
MSWLRGVLIVKGRSDGTKAEREGFFMERKKFWSVFEEYA